MQVKNTLRRTLGFHVGEKGKQVYVELKGSQISNIPSKLASGLSENKFFKHFLHKHQILILKEVEQEEAKDNGKKKKNA